MNKCKKCNVVILDDTDRCPLCKHVLESDGIPGESRYPDAIATARKFRFVENLVLFISIVAECLLIAINFQVDREVAWSLVIGIILLYGNVVLRMAILGKSGYLAKTVCLVLLAIVMLLGIDYLTGYRRWSLDYVLPGGIIAIDLALFILILINRRNSELYDVGTADDIAEHCAGGIAADENHSFSISGMGVPRGIGIFIPWNTDSW